MNDRVKSMRAHLLTVAVAATLAIPGTALAQREINDSRPVSATVNVEVDEIIVGHLTIIGWERNEMSVTGTIGRDVDEFVIEGGGESVEIYADWDDWDDHDEDGRRRWRGRDHDDVDINLEIRVPRGASLELTGITASFDVQDVDGEIEIESTTGNISYSGNARSLDLVNITGEMRVRAPALREGDFETVQGSIYFEGSVAVDGNLDFETVQGTVELVLPADVSAHFDIETTLGEISNEFGPEPRRTSRWVPSKELSFTTGTGSADIYIETLQGHVILRRQ